MCISNFNKFRKYSKEKDLKYFKLLDEEAKQKEIDDGGGGTSFMVTIFIWVLSVIMSVNVYASM